jgi:hypothetical protein
MWKRVVSAVVGGALLAVGGMAAARSSKHETPYRSKKVIEIVETGAIEGRLLAPSTILSAELVKTETSSLIEYRFDFTPEIVDSGDKL